MTKTGFGGGHDVGLHPAKPGGAGGSPQIVYGGDLRLCVLWLLLFHHLGIDDTLELIWNWGIVV